MEKNKEIISEITRIKEIFNYGALLNEQKITAQFQKTDKSNSNFTNHLINAFKNSENTKGKEFEMAGDEMLKYTAKINNEDKIIILNTNAGQDNGIYYEVTDEGNNVYKWYAMGNYTFKKNGDKYSELTLKELRRIK